MFLYGISSNHTEEKQKEIYQYSIKFFNSYGKKCIQNKFFSIRRREYADFPIIPKECDDIALDGIDYKVHCKKISRKCNQNTYDNYEGDCLPLNLNDRISQ